MSPIVLRSWSLWFCLSPAQERGDTVREITRPSFPRRRESSGLFGWVPAFAGTTNSEKPGNAGPSYLRITNRSLVRQRREARHRLAFVFHRLEKHRLRARPDRVVGQRVAGRPDARRACAGMATPFQARTTSQMARQRHARREPPTSAMPALRRLPRERPLPAHRALA